MRVGLIVPGFSANAEDWCIPALRHLARALASTGDVRVITLRYPYRAERYTVDGAEVIALGGAARRGLATLDVWRKALGVVRQEHRRRAFDVLHAFWATESGFLAALAGRLLRIPTLVSLAGGELVALPAIDYGDQRVAWERLKIRASLRLASGVSVGSHYLLRLAQRHVHNSRLRLAPLGVDLDLFSPGLRRARASAPRVIHVGTLTPVKDQATLLRAFRLVHDRVSGVSLDIVGDGPLRTQLERLAHELSVSDAVHFRGDVDHAALPDLYRNGRAFVLSSRHEAQGMVVVEAAACGTPVVGTRVGVIPELAFSADGVAPVGAVEALATGLVAALETSDQRGEHALDIARGQFALSTCAARFRDVYTQLAAP
jgi:glycosyltransferase involved in cell wall biosynthesis